ncbi:Hypothetical protein NTJ_03665 [Nesidiocoris tenuis]|uniref:WH2 domain-containing protein n=1 Tax=Nesidiocoris tenuis TaxID=355587 RepID=A0ABN7AIZ7_9HEMI|nr:Hypothetical protein NTJ_03665 [Nesidiocoris tenuis]
MDSAVGACAPPPPPPLRPYSSSAPPAARPDASAAPRFSHDPPLLSPLSVDIARRLKLGTKLRDFGSHRKSATLVRRPPLSN